jgi:transcriptional regulator with XRE-family HTH domain/tetratricopeptide (TPR) repeat protein
MDDECSFGMLLRELRLAAGLTQEGLAARSGLSIRSISDLERGRSRRPFFHSVEMLADALEVPERVRTALHEAARHAGRETAEATVDSAREARADQSGWPVCQLPPVAADFTGRKDECVRVRRSLARGRGARVMPVVVVSGPPGMGKTTLGLRVGHSLRAAFPDGQLYLQLAGASCRPREAGEVLGEVLRALGVAPAAIPDGAEQRAALYRSRLADRKVLVVADDAGSAGQVEPLLPGTAGCAVIVTSRSTLAGLDGAKHAVLDVLGPAEAVELLSRIVGAERVAAEPRAAERLVEACGLLPLAVRIAGAKLAARPDWPLERLAGLVADERHRLDELTVGDLAVRASVAPSYEALDERGRRGFRRLALLGPVDVADWVMAALLGEPDAADVLGVLVDRSLLIPAGVDATGEPRYRLHDLLRDYAAERLAEEPETERDAAMGRVVAAYLARAAMADQLLPQPGFFPAPESLPAWETVMDGPAARPPADPIAWFSAERLNLLAISAWACTHGEYRVAARLAHRQLTFQLFQHRVDDTEQIWQAIEETAARAGDIAMSSQARFYLAWVLAIRGRFGDARAALEMCVPRLAACGVRSPLAVAFYWRSYCAEALGHYEMQREDAERCLVLARQLGDRGLEVAASRLLGLALTRLGSHDRGIALCEQAVAIARDRHESGWEYWAVTSLAFSLCLAGRHQLAEGWCREGIEVSRRIGSYVIGQAFLLGMLGDAFAGQGRYQEAVDVLSAAMAVFEQHGDRRSEALCLLKQGQAYLALGRKQQAADFLQRCFPIFRELGLPAYEDTTIRALDECRPTREVTLADA